jgi:hypothetical protein
LDGLEALASFKIEDYELDPTDEEEPGFLADPCTEHRSNRSCRSAHRCKVVGDSCKQKLDICSGLSKSECTTHERRDYCRYTSPRGGTARCERIEPCDGMDRNVCNEHSPDCRWDQGGCVRKHEGESSGPTGDCNEMECRQCDRAKLCLTNTATGRCVPNTLGGILNIDGIKVE